MTVGLVFDEDLSSVGIVEKEAESAKGNGKCCAGGENIKQLANGGSKSQKPNYKCGEKTADNDSNEGKAAHRKICKGMGEAFVLIGAAVPVDNASDNKTENHCDGEHYCQRSGITGLGGRQSEAHGNCGDNGQHQYDGGPVYYRVAHYKSNFIHVITSQSGMAVAKYIMSLIWR